MTRIRLIHALLAAVLVYSPLYVADYWCGHCISSMPAYWPFH